MIDQKRRMFPGINLSPRDRSIRFAKPHLVVDGTPMFRHPAAGACENKIQLVLHMSHDMPDPPPVLTSHRMAFRARKL